MIESFENAAKCIGPIEKDMSLFLLPTGHSSRCCGVVIKRHDGSVVLEPDPWEA
jgi:hypothetical protein